MLVLSRKPGRVVMIGDHIRVTVLGVREDGAVSLGIDAPREIPVHRDEVYERIQQRREK